MTSLAISIRAQGLSVVPGGSVSFAVEVVNLGSVVDRYRCELVGVPEGWWSVGPASLELFPQRDDIAHRVDGDAPPTSGRFTVTFHPPRTPEAVAGPLAFGAKVTSEHQPTNRGVEEATIVIEPFGQLKATLRPMVSSGRFGARSGVDFDNQGNRPEVATVEGSDPTDEVRFDFPDTSVTVPAGRTVRLPVRMSAGFPSLIGGSEARPYALAIRPRNADIAPINLSGTLRRTAIVPSGLIGAMAGGLALAMGGLALLTILRPPSLGQAGIATPGAPSIFGGAPPASTQANPSGVGPESPGPVAPTIVPPSASSAPGGPTPTTRPTHAPPPTATPVPTPTPNAGPVFAGPLATNTPSIALALNYETDFTCPGSSRVSIQATVSDPDGIASVELWWKRPKDTAFSKYPYPVFSHVTYWSTSIGQFFGRVYDVGTVSFYAVATDTKGAFTQSQTGSVEVLPCPEAS